MQASLRIGGHGCQVSRLAYISFDRFPAPKGASVHINAFAQALASAFGGVDLLTVAAVPVAPVAGPGVPAPGIRHWPLPAIGANLIERVRTFRRAMLARLDGWRPDVIHVRSIYEGYPLAREKPTRGYKLVFEVNGLPSIELKYHYPDVSEDRELLAKLVSQEQACLQAADLIVTVSQVTAEHLAERGADPRIVRVIPNGVDAELFSFRRPRRLNPAHPVRLLYGGTISAWQGVNVAVDALRLCRRDFDAQLTIVGEGRRRQVSELERRCQSLGLAQHVRILEPVSQSRLAELHHKADVVLAPLKPNDRNLEQGCCPLKVLEAMSSGTPLVASDLPVVRELATGGVDALLVRPGSPKAIKDAILRLRRDPHLGPQLSAAARRRVKQHFSWALAQRRLVEAYVEGLGITALSTSDSASASPSG